MKPRVLLVEPASFPSRSQDFGVPHLLALAAWVERECGVEPVVRDLRHECSPERALREALDESRPRLLGLSCYSSYDYLDTVATARVARAAAPDVPIAVGGYHASACPEDFTGLPELFDFVVVGDGERRLAELTTWAVGGGERPAPVLTAERPIAPDELPSYPFHLLERYAGRARRGAKLQLNLSRGCPHRCTFCMERAKPDRVWRALPPERAVEELRRLDRTFPLAGAVLHVTDPLFGMRSDWRREFLERFAASGLRPRTAWTLTRTEGWTAEQLALAAACRLSLGIGLESGSPAMLERMGKTGRPAEYLEGFLRFRDDAARHGASWAVNVLAGHPGETPDTLAETRSFLDRLFPPGRPTGGWLSVDPFRLYPGSEVHRHQARWTAEYGARFHAPRWWLDVRERDVASELVDPSRALDALARLHATFTQLRPIALRVAADFRCADPDAAPVFARSLEEQRDALSPEAYERRLRIYAVHHPAVQLPASPPAPGDLGLELVGNDEALAAAAARAFELRPGARCGLVGDDPRRAAAVLRAAVGETGLVLETSLRPGRARRVLGALRRAAGRRDAGRPVVPPALGAAGITLVVALGAYPAIPRALAAWLRARPGRRLVVTVGPRFGEQRVLHVASGPDGVRERTVARARLLPAGGPGGWIG
ncbi:MAG: radical SAM protein [Deltaproteobacteria bacterium]|nr:radical SAM protein [Deltaproteobacteria bacterium]